uniref:Uncharacterized protein n=1 Tax=Anopheles farauti TaxID=69004 RepID=A0A182QJM6_9DIPT
MLAIGNKLELHTDNRSIYIRHVFRQPEQVMDQSIDFEIEIMRKINDMKLQFAYYGMARNGTVQNVIVKRQVDLCFYLRHPKSDRVVNVVYHYVATHGHTPSRCPMAKGSYYMRNLKPADIPIPPFLPESEFMLELIYRSEVRSVPLVEFRFYGKLTRFISNLLPIASKVNLKYDRRTFNVSYAFNEPKTLYNQSLGFEIDILRTLKDAKFLLLLNAVTKSGTMQTVLLKRQIDLCFFLRNPKSDRLMKTVYDYVRERSHIPARCPFTPGSYYMRNMRLVDAPIPAFLPETEFILDIIYYSEVRAEKQVEFRIYGRLLSMVYYAVALNGSIQSALVRRTVDLCFFLRRPTSDRLLKSFYDYIKERSKLPAKCPVPADDYNMRDLRLGDIPIPAFLPEAEGMVETIYLTGLRQELVPVANKIELKVLTRSVNVTYKFHQRKSMVNQSLEFDVDITRQLKDLKLLLVYYVIALNGTVHNALIKRPIDVCFFFRNPRSDRLVKSIYDYIKERSNFTTRCPIERGRYYVRNVRPADVPVPSFLPEAEFIFELIYHSEVRSEKMIEFRFHGKLLIPVLSKVVVKYNPKFINVSSSLNNIDSITNQTVTFEMEMYRELKDMKATFSYYVVGLDGSSLNHMISRTVDVCSFIKRPSMDRFVKNVYEHMKRNNRIPTVCPIPATNYYIRNVRPAAVRLPGFFPESSFVFDNNYYSGIRSEPMVECRFHGKLVRVTDDMLQ